MKKFDVYEVKIADPDDRRVLVTGISEKQAEDYIKIAVMRRGVETHFFTKRPQN